MRIYPALEVAWPHAVSDDDRELVLADLDEFAPSAVDQSEEGMRVFFTTPAHRDAAGAYLASQLPAVRATPVDVPDENWAERSQASLGAVRAGRVVVAPPWAVPPESTDDSPANIVIVVEPSMGFGTGHHPTTRLCLTLSDRRPREGARVLDVGTGSGVLAVAAWRLGALSVTAIDSDPDAIDAAKDTVSRNAAHGHVRVGVEDIVTERAASSEQFDLTLANLTGGLLLRVASALVATLRPGGELIVSGLQTDERDAVVARFEASGVTLADEAHEAAWVGLAFRRA